MSSYVTPKIYIFGYDLLIHVKYLVNTNLYAFQHSSLIRQCCDLIRNLIYFNVRKKCKSELFYTRKNICWTIS